MPFVSNEPTYDGYNNAIITINSFRNQYLCHPIYRFADLPPSEQKELIESAQSGSSPAYDKILSGFWKCLASLYINTLGTIKVFQIRHHLIPEQLNDGLYRMCQCISKHNSENALSTFIYSSLSRRCYTYRLQHVENNNVSTWVEYSKTLLETSKKDNEDEDTGDAHLTLSLRLFNKWNVRSPLPLEYVGVDSIEANVCLEQDTENKELQRVLFEFIRKLYSGPRNEKKRNILLYYFHRVLMNDPCSLHTIGVLFQCNRHTIGQLIATCKTQLRRCEPLKHFYHE